MLSRILVRQCNVVAVVMPSGLCCQKKKVFKEQKINASVESSKIERASFCAQRSKAWIKTTISLATFHARDLTIKASPSRGKRHLINVK